MPVLASYWLAVVITAVAKCAAATARLLLPLLLLSWGGRAIFAGPRHTRSQLDITLRMHATQMSVTIMFKSLNSMAQVQVIRITPRRAHTGS